MKEEVVFLKPRIVVYHDFLSDREVETIKRLATPRFKRATVQNYKTGELETASYRYLIYTIHTLQKCTNGGLIKQWITVSDS